MKRALLLIFLACLCSVFALAGKDPADYPLKVHVLQQRWLSHNVHYGQYKGTGRGNIWEGTSIHGLDFTCDCSFGLSRTARNQPYVAKWKKPQLRLELLAMQIGKESKYQECELQTTVREGVYIMGGGGITEISHEDFNRWRAKREAARSGQQTGSTANGVSKLSVSSTPDSADIEIDGEFMGNTPSALELNPGEHSVAVRKAGYKIWEKKLKLVSGEIKLNADLEPDPSK